VTCAAGRRTARGPGEAIGATAGLDETPRTATAVAQDEVEILRIGGEEFREILHEQVEIAAGVIRVLTRRLHATDAAIQRRRRSAAG
jgi:CRP-like cAMP-binding protein